MFEKCCGIEDFNWLIGLEKVVVILFVLGEEDYGLWNYFDEEEICEVFQVMLNLGMIFVIVVEKLIVDFVGQMFFIGLFMGLFEVIQCFLVFFLLGEKVEMIMEELCGFVGWIMWDKLGNVNEVVFVNYFKNEYLQMVVVVLFKVKLEYVFCVFGVLLEDFVMEVVICMLCMELVQCEILDCIEEMLCIEFMFNLVCIFKYDSYEMMVLIFNNFDCQIENCFLVVFEECNCDSVEKICLLMFVFEDLFKLDLGGIQMLMCFIDKDQMVLVMKGVFDSLCDFFFFNMFE